MEGVGFADTEGDGLMTGVSIGVGTCVPVSVGEAGLSTGSVRVGVAGF
jgi:hypothetical protein